MTSSCPLTSREPAVQPLATGLAAGAGLEVGIGVGVTVGAGVAVATAVGTTAGDAEGEPDGDGEADDSHPEAMRRVANRRPAGRHQPAGIGLVGVVLEAAHGGQRRVAQELRLALEQGKLGTKAGGSIGRLQQTLLA